MNINLKILLVLFFFCDYGLPQTYFIKGKLIDERYFPVPNVSVFISNGNSANTDVNGEFKLITTRIPFNITVTDKSLNREIYYTNISDNEIELMYFGKINSAYINTEIVKIELPEIKQGNNVTLKFISEELFYSKEIIASTGEKSKTITVDFPSNTKSINGKIILIEKSSTSFEKFMEKTITIRKDSYPLTIIFDSLTFTKKLQTSNIAVYPPFSSLTSKGFSVLVDFLTLHKNSEFNLYSADGDIITTKIIVPSSLPYGYRLKIKGYGTKDNSFFENYIYTYPGSSFNLNVDISPSLDAPQDKFWNVNKNTVFSFDWGSGTGIYVICFKAYNPEGEFYLVTTDRNIKSPLAFSSVLKGEEFSWQVFKYTTYLSVNDFVKPRTKSNDINFRGITKSELRTFKTTF